MRVTLKIPASRAMLSAALEGLTAVDAVMYRQRRYPKLYSAGIRYQRERVGRENWQTVAELYKSKVGDCEDLAAARAAELRMQGIPARAVAVRTGARSYHALVRWPDGSIEDPSRILGMGKGKRK